MQIINAAFYQAVKQKELIAFFVSHCFYFAMKTLSSFFFAPVIVLPKVYEVFDFSKGYNPDRQHDSAYGVGKYNEKRPNMYIGDLYADQRDIHMGVDIMAPVGTSVHAFYKGEIFMFANNNKELDYGYTIITKHQINGQFIYALYGHVAKKSLDSLYIGKEIAQGEVIAYVGDKQENGNWNPHLHFQLSIEEPKVCDMPGVVHEKDLKEALVKYPDPRLVLGPIY